MAGRFVLLQINSVIDKRQMVGETRNHKFANEGRLVSRLTHPNKWWGVWDVWVRREMRT